MMRQVDSCRGISNGSVFIAELIFIVQLKTDINSQFTGKTFFAICTYITKLQVRIRRTARCNKLPYFFIKAAVATVQLIISPVFTQVISFAIYFKTGVFDTIGISANCGTKPGISFQVFFSLVLFDIIESQYNIIKTAIRHFYFERGNNSPVVGNKYFRPQCIR